MCFDVSLPFVNTVYDLVKRGKLDECAAWLASSIAGRPATRLHCVVDCNFDHLLPEYADWLFSGCNRCAKLDSSIAICASMGEFEINYHNWTAAATGYENYDDPANPYQWLCESYRRSLGDWFHFSGFEMLRDAFAHADDIDDRDPNAKPQYESDIYTAACYLVFVYFLRLNRRTHELAHKQRHALARAHLFCHYGDCLYHSLPQTDGQ